MTQARLSVAECNAIHITRESGTDEMRKALKRTIFARAKVQFGIPANHKLVAETDVTRAVAGILRNKDTRETYDLTPQGRWVGATQAAEAAAASHRWFRLPVSYAFDAVVEALDSVEVNEGSVFSKVETPAYIATIREVGSTHNVLLDTDGNMWVNLSADSYEHNGNDEAY